MKLANVATARLSSELDAALKHAASCRRLSHCPTVPLTYYRIDRSIASELGLRPREDLAKTALCRLAV